MYRRPFLTAVGAVATGSLVGCLSAEAGYETTPTDYDPPAGRHQWGYDARNSHHAAGLSGPTESPALQRVYTESGGMPLTEDGTLNSPTTAITFDGERRWEVPMTIDRTAWDSALFEDNIVSVGRAPPMCWAIDQRDGTERWRIELSTEVGGGLLNQPILTILADHGYFATNTGITAVDLAGQEIAWVADLVDAAQLSGQPAWVSPAVTPAHVFTVNDLGHPGGAAEQDEPTLFALARDTGEINWTVQFEDDTWGFRPVIVGERYVFLISIKGDRPGGPEAGDARTQIVAVDPADGEVAWREAVKGRATSESAVMGGQLFVGHGDELSAFDTSDGSITWSERLEGAEISISCADEVVLAVDMHYLWALDPDDGSTVWRLDLVEIIDNAGDPTDFSTLPSPPIVAGERLFLFYDIDTVAGLW